MKKKVLNQKLSLKKETVISLSGSQMDNVIGGYIPSDPTNTAVACSWVGLPCITERKCNC